MEPPESALRVCGLFAGIGGVEQGLHVAGHRADFLCEIEPAARAVLRAHYPETQLLADVREIASLPEVDLLAAGFPCQDLSQAGRTVGIGGERSGLVDEVFRLLEGPGAPRWLLLENVPFMLQLQRGLAMRHLTTRLEQMGFCWAYRVIDARSFGLPQRRRRVMLLASRDFDPRGALFSDDAGGPAERPWTGGDPCGFYWTEGLRGWGWTVDGVPTLKGGSTIGIPSPPAIWFPDRRTLETPDVRDAERMQGFEADWTLPATEVNVRAGARWKLVGNAVSVPVARWLGQKLRLSGTYSRSLHDPLHAGSTWPIAAWGARGQAFRVEVSEWPVRQPYQGLRSFLRFPTRPLSMKATLGFLQRARRSTLRYEPRFLVDVEHHLRQMGGSL